MLTVRNDFAAIVIGASAGGFHALIQLLEGIPRGYAVPIILVQHRWKNSGDLLEELLQRRCQITIKQADEKDRIVPGVAYVAPPDYHLLVETDHTLSLSSDLRVCYSRPSIDVLFESAAFAYKNKLIGIILTGANNDGAQGISAIKASGGLTIAQNPDEAQFPYMTKASIDTGAVQYIWSIATIRNFLLKLSRK